MPEAPLTELDLRSVVAEIYADVQRRRRLGEYPLGLERELDELFAEFAPPSAAGDDMALLLDRASRASFVDVDVPTASNRPGLPYVKRGLRKAMGWYLRYLAQQVSALGGVLTRGLGLLDERVTRLEAVVAAASPRVAEELAAVEPELLPEGWRRFVVERLVEMEPAGRVLHAECGDGALVGELHGAGLDAYGVDPARHLLAAATRAGLDVRGDGAVEHLSALGDATLGGLVVTGVVERAEPAVLIEVADRAAAVLVPGGPLVVVSATPEAWGTEVGAVTADLSPGRPLRAATWRHLLAARGFTAVEVVDGQPGAGGRGPAAYAVVARRGHRLE